MRTSAIALGLVAAALSPTLVSCAPFPADGGSAATSSGGNASGGSVNGPANGSGLGTGLGLINMFSNKAGNGGTANSGNAMGGSGGTFSPASAPVAAYKAPAAKPNTKRPKPSSEPKPAAAPEFQPPTAEVGSEPAMTMHAGDNANAGAATSGEGGQVSGGSINNPGGALNVFGNEAGNGGSGASGNAVGGNMKRAGSGGWNLPFMRPGQKKRTNGGPASSQQGGNASGGSVNGGDDRGLAALNILNIGSNNAGDGGLAKSGDSLGGIGGHAPERLITPGRPSITKAKSVAGSGGQAVAGEGGMAPGGSVNTPQGLINLWSNNAGDGGDGRSGSANGGAGGVAL